MISKEDRGQLIPLSNVPRILGLDETEAIQPGFRAYIIDERLGQEGWFWVSGILERTAVYKKRLEDPEGWLVLKIHVLVKIEVITIYKPDPRRSRPSRNFNLIDARSAKRGRERGGKRRSAS